MVETENGKTYSILKSSNTMEIGVMNTQIRIQMICFKVFFDKFRRGGRILIEWKKKLSILVKLI